MNVHAYMCFIKDNRAALRGIARASRDSSTIDDVQNEIWITADHLSTVLGCEIDFNNDEHQNQLLAWTHQRLVHFCDKKLRHTDDLYGSRFDGGLVLGEMLSHGVDDDPANILAVSENAEQQAKLDGHVSIGAAWISLLEMCENRMTVVAEFLKISLSHSYRCCNKVTTLSQIQRHLPLTIIGEIDLRPRPWRRYRLCREPEQLAFEFDEKLFQ